MPEGKQQTVRAPQMEEKPKEPEKVQEQEQEKPKVKKVSPEAAALVEGRAGFDTTTWSSKLYYRCRKCFFGSFDKEVIEAHVSKHVK
jgi:hypothetical protein